MHVRPPRHDDIAGLPRIERAAGEAFRTLGMDAVADDEPMGTDVLEGHRLAGRAWVAVDAADRPVGYLVLDVVDGAAHVEQVTAHPDARGQRLGAALLDVAQAWSVDHASGALTLTTFADVPWNAPYYRRLGFTGVPEEDLTPGLRAVVAHEAGLGLDAWPRTVVRRETPLLPRSMRGA